MLIISSWNPGIISSLFSWEWELYEFVYDVELLLFPTYAAKVISRIENMHF